MVRLDSLEIESLYVGSDSMLEYTDTYVGRLTSRISVLDIEPCMSCLFAKMSRDAPASRCEHSVS